MELLMDIMAEESLHEKGTDHSRSLELSGEDLKEHKLVLKTL